MDKMAMRPASDRRDLFSESASELGMNPVIVEKDFWVCWILKRLFADPPERSPHSDAITTKCATCTIKNRQSSPSFWRPYRSWKRKSII